MASPGRWGSQSASDRGATFRTSEMLEGPLSGFPGTLGQFPWPWIVEQRSEHRKCWWDSWWLSRRWGSSRPPWIVEQRSNIGNVGGTLNGLPGALGHFVRLGSWSNVPNIGNFGGTPGRLPRGDGAVHRTDSSGAGITSPPIPNLGSLLGYGPIAPSYNGPVMQNIATTSNAPGGLLAALHDVASTRETRIQKSPSFSGPG